MNEFFIRNYHTHTFRCGHAVGEDEEYVKHAIKGGIKVLGFADHCILPDYVQPGMRGDPEMIDDYISSLEELKEKYKDQIEIHIGFECEYMPEYLDYYKYLLETKKVEYLIMGQHCHMIDGKIYFYVHVPGGRGGLLESAQDMVKGIKTGLFKYVCHPDMFMEWWKKWDDTAIEAARMICKAASEYHVPLEINGGRHRPGSANMPYEGKMIPSYPYPPFWKIAAEYGCEVIFGMDAHNPVHLDEMNYDDMYQMAKDFGLKIVEKLDL
ncbi:MAG: histidinol-phosphatase [Bacilli bacterium]|nr:histidinol-phosphatase [Bacilli bacterium]